MVLGGLCMAARLHKKYFVLPDMKRTVGVTDYKWEVLAQF
jgi:hypothetical protein